VRALAERLGAPVVTSVNGRGTLPETHPLALGATLHLAETQSLLANADAVLVVGCELAESDTWASPVAVGGPIVRVDVDPGMSATNAPPAAVLLVGRAETVLPALLGALGPGDPVSSATHVAGDRDRIATAAESAAQPWCGLVSGLRRALPPDSVVVADNAKVAYHAAQTRLPMTRPRSYLYPTGFGTLGWAVPAAVGAVAAAPGRPVVALTGDGGLQFSVAELATLRDLGAGVPVVVVDNGGYGEIRDQMVARGDRPTAVDLRPPRWSALADAFGAAHVDVLAATDEPSCADEVADAVTTALSADRPTLVVVREAGAP
jgi:acetolactate synthase-1/2/3 large subunit